MEAAGIVILVVLFVVIMTAVDIQKKKHYNSFTEVLDGDILSYECQRTGIVIDTKQRTVRFFDKEGDKTYSYDNIREINYTLSEGGKFYGNGTLKGMNNAAIANWREQLAANKRYDEPQKEFNPINWLGSAFVVSYLSEHAKNLG